MSARMEGQLGNRLFQIAAASALAWDHGAQACFPDLHPSKKRSHYDHVYFRCCVDKPRKPDFLWTEPSFAYHPIPYHPNMLLSGYFQCEKYFCRHREKILDLFAPCPDDRRHIEQKYGKLLEHPMTVGVQLRWYNDYPGDTRYIQYGMDYLTKAMALFPQNALFLVSSNNLWFARQCIPSADNVVYLENEPDYIDLFVLSLCKHNIISNSSFGWWAAWLNRNPKKLVICPSVWVNPNWPLPTQDICPSNWIKLVARWGNHTDPRSCD